MRKKLVITMVMLTGISFSGFSQQAGLHETVRIHFVGNSYTYYNNLPQVLHAMAESRDINMVTSKSVFGGAELREHWNNGSDDKPAWNINTRETLRKGKYDVVILQEQSMSPVDYPDSTLKYVHLFSELVRELGGTPCLYLTWARERMPQMQQQVTGIYRKAGMADKILLAPVGEAFLMARSLRPGMKLFAEDGTHPSYLGTYLASCTFFATLTGEDPVGLPRILRTDDKFGESIVLMNVNPEDAVFLQTVARDIVSEWDQKACIKQ